MSINQLIFCRPVGAKADVAELKYVSALLQTAEELRPDCSLKQTDISALLRSKYGIEITDEEVEDVILRGLSTGSQCVDLSSANQGQGTFDLCELVAALIMPDLLKIAEQNDTDEDDIPHNVLDVVLDSIAKTALGSPDQELIINREYVRQILISIGEVELAHNSDLIKNMIEQATPRESSRKGDPDLRYLNASAFARALTDDLHCDTTFQDLIKQEKQNIFGGCKRRFQISAQTEEAEDKDKASQQENAELDVSTDDKPGIDKAIPTGDDAVDQVNGNPYKVKHTFITPSIDYLTDPQASRFVAVGLWIFFLLHILASGSFGLQDFPSVVPSDLEMCPDTPNVGCDTLEVFLEWVDSLITLFIIGGVFIMLIGSLGNRVDDVRHMTVLISLIPVLYFFIKPFTHGTAPEDLEGAPHRQFALGSSMLVAMLILIHRMKQFTFLFEKPRCWLESGSKMAKFLSRGLTGTSVQERHQAASHKVNRILFNACNVAQESVNIEKQSNIPQSMEGTVATFYEGNDDVEKVGGHIWIWKRMRNRSLYCQEGIQLSARLLAANIMQYLIIIYIVLFVLMFTESVVESYDGSTIIIFVRSAEAAAVNMIDGMQSLHNVAVKAVDLTLTSVFPALRSLRIESCEALASSNYGNSSFVLPEICTSSDSTFLLDLEKESQQYKLLLLAAVGQKIDPAKSFLKKCIGAGAEVISDLTVVIDPLEPWHIQMAFGIGGLIAFLASIFLALLYIPSVASTTMKFRCGIIPTMDDPKHFSKNYRGGMHNVTFLTGALFWGSLVYVAGLACIIAFIVLVCIWLTYVGPAINTTHVTPGVPGIILGSVAAFVVQYILFNIGTGNMYKSFYRRHPGWASIHSILWEAAWIGLSILFVVMRALKLIVVATLQIGRIDIPFLQDGVGVYAGMHLDRFPAIFRQDILAHEAHNHPYIERLSIIYLLKIRHRDSFANSAGTAWRLIFVLTLFPWLRKYRVNARCTSMMKSPARIEALEEGA